MDNRSDVSAWGQASGPPRGLAYLSALGRRLRGSKTGTLDGRSGSKADVEATKAGKEAGAQAIEGARIVACPECQSPALIVDEGVTLAGIGYCSHEYLFKMVKVHCAKGHEIDALDEEGCVHTPDFECSGD